MSTLTKMFSNSQIKFKTEQPKFQKTKDEIGSVRWLSRSRHLPHELGNLNLTRRAHLVVEGENGSHVVLWDRQACYGIHRHLNPSQQHFFFNYEEMIILTERKNTADAPKHNGVEKTLQRHSRSEVKELLGISKK